MSRNVNPTTRGEVLMVGGYIEEGERTVTTTPDTMTDGDFQVASDLTVAAAVAITLPSAGVGKVFRIRDKKGDAGTNNVTVSAPSGETIEGAGTVVINVNYGAITLRKSTTTTWHVVARNYAASGALGAHAASHKAGGSDALLSAPGAIGGGTPAAGTFTTLTVNTSIALAAGADISAPSAGASDFDFSLSTGALKLGSATATVGFFGATAVAQPSSVGQTAGFTAGAGTTAKDDSTYTGGTGSKAYTVGDIVKHLKALGLLAAS